MMKTVKPPFFDRVRYVLKDVWQCLCERTKWIFSWSRATATSSPVQVYILLGQSNMLGMGKVGNKDNHDDGTLYHAVYEKGLYSYLVDDSADSRWKQFPNIRYVQVMGSGGASEKTKVLSNEWLTIKSHAKIGPEFGIAHSLRKDDDDTRPMLLLKSCIGNRALGWDLLPPGSPGYEYKDSKGTTWVHPGYHGSPERWEKGTTPEPSSKWYAGIQYDGDIARAKHVLEQLDVYYPGSDGYEVAGFFWWQGDRDSRSEDHASRYETNLTQLILKLRQDFDAPEAKFVCGSLGQTVIGNEKETGDKKILDAMLEAEKDPQFKGTVAAVYTHPYSKGGSSGGHYNANSETYMNIGEALGAAMSKLERIEKKTAPPTLIASN